MLRSISKQSRESTYSVLKKKRKAAVGRICRNRRCKPGMKKWKGDGILILISMNDSSTTILWTGIRIAYFQVPFRSCAVIKPQSDHDYNLQPRSHNLSLYCTMDHRNFIHRLAVKTPTNTQGWLGSRVVTVLDWAAVGPEFKSQSRRSRITVLGKLFTPILPLFTKQQNW